MKALRWHGTGDVSVDTVDDPQILEPTDCIIETTLTAICGSDLHLYDGYIPTMEDGDILGHEFMGRVVEVGSEVQTLKKGDRVVVPFPIACGHCHYCNTEQYSLCDNSNRNAEMQAAAYGYAAAGIFGYSHMLGGFAGGQAEYVRVPYADVGPMTVPDSLTDEQVLFLTDIYPTGYQAAVNCDIEEGDTVVVWGCGPVGLFAQISAKMLGANVIGIDREPERLRMAEQFAGSATIDFEDEDVFEKLKDLNDGRGPDACIDAVGLESHGVGLTGAAQKAEQTLKLQTDRRDGAHRGRPELRQGRDRLDPGRLRRRHQPLQHRRRLREGADVQDGPDPRAEVHPGPPRAHRARRARPELHHHAQGPAGEGARALRDVPRQEGRLRQGRPRRVVGRGPRGRGPHAEGGGMTDAVLRPRTALRGRCREADVRRRGRTDDFGPVPRGLRVSVAAALTERPARLRALADALAAQRLPDGTSPFGEDVAEALVALDEDLDVSTAELATVATVHPWLRIVPVRLGGVADRAGRARQLAADAACTRLLAAGDPDGLVVPLDLDARPASDTLARMLAEVDRGADAVRNHPAVESGALYLVGTSVPAGGGAVALTARAYAWVGGLAADATPGALADAVDAAGGHVVEWESPPRATAVRGRFMGRPALAS